jgi:hypothetical protein
MRQPVAITRLTAPLSPPGWARRSRFLGIPRHPYSNRSFRGGGHDLLDAFDLFFQRLDAVIRGLLRRAELRTLPATEFGRQPVGPAQIVDPLVVAELLVLLLAQEF